MNLDQEDLKPCKTTLVGFNGELFPPKGYIDLRLTLGTKEGFKSERVRFIVAEFPSPYNVILGRSTIHNWDMHSLIPTPGSQKPERREGLRRGEPSQPVNMVELDLREDSEIPRPEPEGELEDLIVGNGPTQIIKIGRTLSSGLKIRLEELLTMNRDVFAWSPSKIPGIDPDFCCHKLAIQPESSPVAQEKRKIGPDRQQALVKHVDELLEAGFIREIQYTTWLSNVVMVLKPNGKWRVCTDYTNLNKACPKDSYLMPNLD
ncbi:hypothetical protein K1719_034819 [Acacia pycnantha]|nr:hypothetical protein K1719_034819 [Acacia pycnantha]